MYGALYLIIYSCNKRILNGFSDILVYGSEVQSGCKIIANGSSDSEAVITVDFGQGPCISGSTATLGIGSISINGNDEIVSFATSFKDIIFLMSNCNDEVSHSLSKSYSCKISINLETCLLLL